MFSIYINSGLIANFFHVKSMWQAWIINSNNNAIYPQNRSEKGNQRRLSTFIIAFFHCEKLIA